MHDNLWTRLKNAHPYADSSDIEHMMTLVYQGQSVGEASRDGFASYDPDMVEHLLSLKEEEVLDLTGKLVVDDSLDDDDDEYAEEEDEEGADEA